jgi:hypothetical protein
LIHFHFPFFVGFNSQSQKNIALKSASVVLKEEIGWLRNMERAKKLVRLPAG